MSAGPPDPEILPVERALIGGVLIDNFERIPPLLSGEFLLEKHRVIWDTITTLSDRGEHPDLHTVHGQLVLDGNLELAGGPGHLALLMEEGCIAAHRMQYARIIRAAARARQLAWFGKELQAKGLTDTEIAERLDAIPGPLGSALFDPPDAWRKIQEAWGERKITMGLTALDDTTGGIGRGELVIVAGRTSHGKTAFTCDAALRLARRGVMVELITLEETQEAIVRRLIGNMTGISVKRIKSGGLGPSEMEACTAAARDLAELPLTVTSSGSLESSHVIGLVAQSRATVVMLDHLQKVITDGDHDSRVYGLEKVLNRLHGVGLKTGAVVWVNCQLNREMERAKRAPELTDLRDSGAIEILARQIWMLYWPYKHDESRTWTDYELWARKTNDGGTGMVPLHFTAPSGQFDNA